MPKTQFLQMTTFRGRFLCTRWMQFWQVCQKFFIRRLNFLKYFYFSEKNGFFSHFFSRHAKCSFNNRRKTFAIHLNFFPTNFRINFQILFSDIFFKMVLERCETQFSSNLPKIFRSVLFHFSLKIQTFINNLNFSKENSLLLNFSGTHWRQFRQTWQQIFAEGPKNEQKSFRETIQPKNECH